MKIFITFCTALLLTSCNFKKKNEAFYGYFFTNSLCPDKLKSKEIVYRSYVSKDSVKISLSEEKSYKFRYEKRKDGLYVFKSGKRYLLYSFSENRRVERAKVLYVLFKKVATLVEKKTFQVDGKEVTIYHYHEQGFDGTMESYYMENYGFMCFYSFGESGYYYLDSPQALKISNQFLRDTAFFEFRKIEELKSNLKIE